MKPVAIIGGGITGLTAAFQLQRRKVPVTLYEAGSRVGGVIQSLSRDGYLAEFGPNTILETSPRIGQLIEELDLGERRWYSDDKAGKRFLVREHKLVEVPDSPVKFFTSGLFSAGAKLRLLREPFVRRARADIEESVAELVLRRLGQEFLDYAINPLVAGIYAGDPARLSVKHAFPKLHALEQRYGSLILGQILGARERKKRAEVSKQAARKISFDQGLQVLPDRLAECLGAAVKLHSFVMRMEQAAGDWKLTVNTERGLQTFEHAAVLYAGTAYRLPEILADGSRIVPSPLAEVVYPPVASVVLGFRRDQVTHPLDGFGVLVPQVEKLNILGTIFSSSLFPNRAPAGHVTLTSYVGGTRAPRLAERSAEELYALTVEDLRILLGVTGRPTFQHLVRYPKAIPQYEVGYGRFRNWMNDVEQTVPGLFLAGHYRDGISLGDSLVSGFDTAARVGAFVTRAPAEAAVPAKG